VNTNPYSSDSGPYQFYRYYSFACPPGMVDQLSRSDVDRGGVVKFRVPLRNGQIFVVIEFPDGIENVYNPNDTYEYKFGCVPALFDKLVNPDAKIGGRLTSVIPHTGDMVLWTMERLRVTKNSRR